MAADQKKPGVLSKPLFVRKGTPAQAPVAWNETPEETKKEPRKHARENMKNSSLYLLKTDHQKLNQLAAAKGMRKQQMIMDAIDAYLVANGVERLTRWESN